MPNHETTLQSEWQKFSHLFKREEVPAKTILLKEGEVDKKSILSKKVVSGFFSIIMV